MKAYIVKGFRTAVGKAPRGIFRFTRPDDLAAATVKHLVSTLPELDVNRIDDVIVGNATPEAEQGLNIGRMISLMGLNTDKVPGVTVNRYCLQAWKPSHWQLQKLMLAWPIVSLQEG